jgi:hypothetical protein
MSGRLKQLLIVIGAGLTMASAATLSVPAERAATQVAGVDNSRMGAYRALAHLSFQAFKNGDAATAAELARILERTWDAAEEGGGPRSLEVTNKDSFEQIDEAMDTFIKPLIHYTTKVPDPLAVKRAYEDFLSKLKQGD